MPTTRVLVVDDNPGTREVLRLILTKAGYEVVEAEDGEDAIATIKSADNPLMVDAIFCDLKMPKVDGMEAIAFFRSHFPAVPVVVITGLPKEQIPGPVTLYKQGVVGCVLKPFGTEQITAVMERAIKERIRLQRLWDAQQEQKKQAS